MGKQVFLLCIWRILRQTSYKHLQMTSIWIGAFWGVIENALRFLETNNANFKINKYYYLENNIDNAIEIKSHMVYNRKKAEHATVFLRTLLFSLGIFFWWPHRREHGARIYLCSELFLRLNINWD